MLLTQNAVIVSYPVVLEGSYVVTRISPRELQKHNIKAYVFLADCAQHLYAALQRAGLRF